MYSNFEKHQNSESLEEPFQHSTMGFSLERRALISFPRSTSIVYNVEFIRRPRQAAINTKFA